MFRLQQHLDDRYKAKTYRFHLEAQSQTELTAWQYEFRHALSQILGIAERPVPTHPPSQRLSVIDRGQYNEEKHALMVDDVQVPLYLLVPKVPPPYKVIIAFHGHGPGVQLILGNDPDPATHAANLLVDENFAQRFAEDGYLVCAIEQRGFGERVTDQITPEKYSNACRHLAFEYMVQGMTLLGERVRDGIATVNWLLNRTDISHDEIICTGHSGGGMTTLFLSALDTRLNTTLISGYFCSYKHSILGMPHCECNYVPRLLTLGDVGEITALIAPRRLCLINGREDPIFPVQGIAEPYEIVQRAYTIANAPDSSSLVFHAGSHRYDYQASLSWLRG